MNSQINLISISTEINTIEPKSTQMHAMKPPSTGITPLIPSGGATLVLLMLSLLAVTGIALITVWRDGSFKLKIGKISLDVQGNQSTTQQRSLLSEITDKDNYTEEP